MSTSTWCPLVTVCPHTGLDSYSVFPHKAAALELARALEVACTGARRKVAQQ